MSKIIFLILRFSGLPWLFRNLFQKNRVTILMFHEISRETAEQTFLYLHKKYNVIDLNEYIDACKIKNKARIPKKALIITFDDGLVSNYEMLPFIKKYNTPITLFLCSEIINTNRHFWYKHKGLSKPLSYYKILSNIDRLKALAKDGFIQDKEYKEAQALSKAQVIEMSKHVNMQSHTKFHPCLPECEFEVAKEEIHESKQKLEDEYGFSINTIAFPNGDYSDRDIELTKEAGYECAITVDGGYNTLKSDLFKLKRFSTNDTDNINELIVKSSGLWFFLKSMAGKKQN